MGFSSPVLSLCFLVCVSNSRRRRRRASTVTERLKSETYLDSGTLLFLFHFLLLGALLYKIFYVCLVFFFFFFLLCFLRMISSSTHLILHPVKHLNTLMINLIKVTATRDTVLLGSNVNKVTEKGSNEENLILVFNLKFTFQGWMTNGNGTLTLTKGKEDTVVSLILWLIYTTRLIDCMYLQV